MVNKLVEQLRAADGCKWIERTALVWLRANGHHIDPHGGEGLGNFALACIACNRIKRRRLPAGDTREARVADAKAHIAAVRANNEARMARGLSVLAAYKEGCPS